MDLFKFYGDSIGAYFNTEKGHKDYVSMDFMTAFVGALIVVLISNALNVFFTPGGANPMAIIMGLIFGLISYVIGVFAFTGLFHLFLKMFGAKGVFTDTAKVGLSLGIFPSLVLLLMPILNSVSEMFSILFGILGLVFVVWSIVLNIIYLSEIHKMSGWGVFGAMFLIFILIVILALLLFFMFASMLFGAIGMGALAA
jgi:hypothetical protein